MRIRKVSEGEESGTGKKGEIIAANPSHEYQTASELFELMSKDHQFDSNDDNSLTPRDLVVLYNNIDKGTKLMSDASKINHQRPNQYVETVVYEDLESDGSDVCEVYSAEELETIFTVNKERLDLLDSNPSFENKLCQKFSGVDIKSSNLTTDYNKHFLFQDPYIKHQIDSLNFGSSQLGRSFLPASLLDYICCRRLEDNYDFYMDNIITYVKHTIEQLKRISNGEYLTERIKEKWKEVDNTNLNKSTKILATSTSIPLHVERKTNRHASTWDDLVRSEVDVRYLSKILEKKIVIEIPKLICGSYKLFTKRCAGHLIISCKNDEQLAIKNVKGDENDSRVDLVFQLQKSRSGHMISNISSIMLVQTPIVDLDDFTEALLPLTYKNTENIKSTDETVRITELCEDKENDNHYSDASTTDDDPAESKDNYFGDHETQCDSLVGTNDYPCSENEFYISKHQSYSESSDSAEILSNHLNTEPFHYREPCFNIGSPDDLRLTMQRLNKQVSLPEESSEDVSLATNTINKKKSPTRVRIKSPYENKSYILEEKKRKRLLEIRERREKRKLALSESCKMNKHKYPKSVLTPQSSNSVTKLSITNKSFYNSIYGETIPIENKQPKRKCRIGKNKDSIPEVPLDQICAENESPLVTTDRNSRKYINRSYYLDDAETEVMYVDMKNKENSEVQVCSAATSAVSSDFQENLKLLSQLIGPSATDLNKEEVKSEDTSTLNEILTINEDNELETMDNVQTSHREHYIAPANSPINAAADNNSEHKKSNVLR